MSKYYPKQSLIRITDKYVKYIDPNKFYPIRDVKVTGDLVEYLIKDDSKQGFIWVSHDSCTNLPIDDYYGKSAAENLRPKKPVDPNAGKMCFAVYGKKLVPKKLACSPIDLNILKKGYDYDVKLDQYFEEFEKFIAYIYAFSTPQAMKQLKPIKTKFRNIYVKREEACRR